MVALKIIRSVLIMRAVLFLETVVYANLLETDSYNESHKRLLSNNYYDDKTFDEENSHPIRKVIKFLNYEDTGQSQNGSLDLPTDLPANSTNYRRSYETYYLNDSISMQKAGNGSSVKGTKSERTRRRKKGRPRWGLWSDWSQCSRSCGGGIQVQGRKCVVRQTPKKGRRVVDPSQCSGLYKQFKMCNEQDCSERVSFRQEQCTQFNEISFEGKTYSWEPYIKISDECQLNCKPIGVNYFATLAKHVQDGTPCRRPAQYFLQNFTGKAVCIDGICEAITAEDGIRGIHAANNTHRCGSVMCRPITGTFSREHLPHGYIQITTIPKGAWNISVKEVKPSKNLLVLKTVDDEYVMNGQRGASPSGNYEAAGVVFQYNRMDEEDDDFEGNASEWIKSDGFTISPIDLLILVKDANYGVKYEYFLPISPNNVLDEDYSYLDGFGNELGVPQDYQEYNKVDEEVQEVSVRRPYEKRRHKYSWKIVGFGPCSRTCGGGRQDPIFRCIKDSPTRFYPPKRCSHLEKPVFNEIIYRCNAQACPPYWHTDDWKECMCLHGEGHQKRNVRCVQEIGTRVVVEVSSVSCSDKKPEESKSCKCPKPSRRKNYYGYKVHKPKKETSIRVPGPLVKPNMTYEVYARPEERRPIIRYVSERTGVWLASEWNGHCSAKCGSGVEYRSIFCDRTPPHVDRCDASLALDTSRICEEFKDCDVGEWFTGRWGVCEGDCFNLVRRREVVCIRDGVVVEDSDCSNHKKPESLKNCTISEAAHCKPRWHYSDWSECSRTCDGGTQKRSVRCIEVDPEENMLVESYNCRYVERQPIYSSCNTQKCPEMIIDPRVDLIQNDLIPTCEDTNPRCHRVFKAKLCHLEYYQRTCCYTCNIANG